jgi:hypothetical protein
MLLVLGVIVTQMCRFGDWQGGEFYYRGVPCPELRAIINDASQVLDRARGPAG